MALVAEDPCSMEMEEYCMAGRVHVAVGATALPTHSVWLCTCCRALAGMTMKEQRHIG